MRKLVTFFTCIMVIYVSPAYALRCGTTLVTEGDHKIEVRQKCGAPLSIEERTLYRVIHVSLPFSPAPREIVVPVLVEEWIYNFGPHRLMRQLRFENGELRRIRALGYGY
jgi:hypothetical protein